MEDTLETFIGKIARELEVKDASAIQPDVQFRQSENWSSMNALIILAFLNVEYGRNYTGQELAACKTFRDIYETLRKAA